MIASNVLIYQVQLLKKKWAVFYRKAKVPGNLVFFSLGWFTSL